MNKKEILEFIDSEVGLLLVKEAENEQGETYISEVEFKQIESIITHLKRLRVSASDREKNLIKVIKEGKGGFVNLTDAVLKEKEITMEGPMILLEPNNVQIHGCTFNVIE